MHRIYGSPNFDELYNTKVMAVHDQTTGKEYEGTKSPRECKFCGKSQPYVTFRLKAHTIPAALGNKRYLTYDECDDCNERIGSVVEDDLCKYLAVERAISRKKARGGTKLRYPPHKSYINSNVELNRVDIVIAPNEQNIRVEDVGNNKARIIAQRPKHNPMNVARALIRMGLFYLPSDFPCFDFTNKWLAGTTSWDPTFTRSGVMGGGGQLYTVLRIFTLKLDSTDFPAFIVQLCYGATVLYAFSPGKDLSQKIPMPVPIPGMSANSPLCNPAFETIWVKEDQQIPAQEVWYEVGYKFKAPLSSITDTKPT